LALLSYHSPVANPKQFAIDRTLKVSVEKVWRMWTIKEGIEKWWGPEDLNSSVRHLDVRVGGRLGKWPQGKEGQKIGLSDYC
jgi:uncharacterized protein YndB with AHSA1/START domain